MTQTIAITAVTDSTNARDTLLRLICAAPDPCGYESKLPGYQPAWDAARKLLRNTCPDHIVDGGGTCSNCHGDTDCDDPAPAATDSAPQAKRTTKAPPFRAAYLESETLDNVQEAFRADPDNNLRATQYRNTALDYWADEMIADETLLAILHEIHD